MKNQHFQSSAFAACSFKKLFSVVFSTVFLCWNLCLFGGRDLPLSDSFLKWFLMVWAPFWLPKPSRRSPGRIPKKRQHFMLIFINFGLFWRSPGETENRQKMLGCTWVVLLFLRQKRICRKVDFQDGMLVDVGFQNVNFGSLVLVFLIYFEIFYQEEPCKLKEVMCLATLRLARHTGSIRSSSSSSSSNSSLARHVMVCNISSCKSQQQQ